MTTRRAPVFSIKWRHMIPKTRQIVKSPKRIFRDNATYQLPGQITQEAVADDDERLMLAGTPQALLTDAQAPCGQQPGYAHGVWCVSEDVSEGPNCRADGDGPQEPCVVPTPDSQCQPQRGPVGDGAVRYQGAYAHVVTVKRKLNPVRHGACRGGDGGGNELRGARQARDRRCEKCSSYSSPAVACSSHSPYRRHTR